MLFVTTSANQLYFHDKHVQPFLLVICVLYYITYVHMLLYVRRSRLTVVGCMTKKTT